MHDKVELLALLVLQTFRVEGHGKAVITDVIYTSETSSEENTSSETKEKYDSIKVS